MKTISVIGLGYIGLPTAALFANNGFKVYGVDRNRMVVDTINSGEVHIEEIGLRTLVAAAVKSGRLKASTEPIRTDVYIIAVPTPILPNTSPDLSHIYSAAHDIIPLLEAGNLVIIESTVPPGTAGEIARIVGSKRTDLRMHDGTPSVLIAHCPERVLPGQILKELVENDRVVGGLTSEATTSAAALYSELVSGNIYKTDATTAEMVKLAENIYRDVNIALANELAVICELLGISVWDVIEFANRHPRVKYLRPGPGVGGHCIAVDPWFIVQQFPKESGLIRAARHRNDSMPHLVVESALDMLGGVDLPKVACLGMSYKGNVGDIRESPSLEIIREIKERLPVGSTVSVNDVHVVSASMGLEPLARTIDNADIVILLTDHREYRLLDPVEVGRSMRSRKLLDTRNYLDIARWRNAGFDARVLGEGRAFRTKR